MGANWRHGPHQDAQKSTRTIGFSSTVCSKFSAVSVMALMRSPSFSDGFDNTPGGVTFDSWYIPPGVSPIRREGVGLVTDLTILTIDTLTLGDRSYLVHDGRVAFVVDPQRDIDRVLSLLDEHGVRLTHVFETHIHNDYVTGGHALAEATGAAYIVNEADEVSFDRTPITD